VHPFLRFYANSPRSPALHYAVAKQVPQFGNMGQKKYIYEPLVTILM
jgi:hypothetical protein